MSSTAKRNRDLSIPRSGSTKCGTDHDRIRVRGAVQGARVCRVVVCGASESLAACVAADAPRLRGVDVGACSGRVPKHAVESGESRTKVIPCGRTDRTSCSRRRVVQVRSCVKYIEENPEKHGLPP